MEGLFKSEIHVIMLVPFMVIHNNKRGEKLIAWLRQNICYHISLYLYTAVNNKVF